VSGSDEDGNLVHGAVLIEGKAGFGSLKLIVVPFEIIAGGLQIEKL
jgi:hypothetical protein